MVGMTSNATTTTFTRMQDATAEDYNVVLTQGLEWNRGLADRVLRHLELLAGESGGYGVDRLTHSLQSATRAERAGRDEEYVVCALLHDIGDTLASMNHSELAATILEPFVSEGNHWIVKHHGIFQGYYFFHHWGLDKNMRERYNESPYYRDTVEFCAIFDQNCFDPAYDTLPVDHFVDSVQRVFANPKKSIYLQA
jgi:predicted HD phosphohydrolase